MITFFSIPKNFQGTDKIHQVNAIKSWQSVHPDAQIFLFGNAEIDKKTKESLNIESLIELETNDYGTPLVSDAFSKVSSLSNSKYLCFINSDIIITKKFSKITENLDFDKFLVAGRRIDIDFDEYLNFNENWKSHIENIARESGKLHMETGSDFYLFKNNLDLKMPEFAIGRATWDNWLIYYCSSKNIPVIDGTLFQTIHPNHDYSHVKSLSKGSGFKGEEAVINFKNSNLKFWQLLNISDSSHYLASDYSVHRNNFFHKFKRNFVKFKIIVRSLLP